MFGSIIIISFSVAIVMLSENELLGVSLPFVSVLLIHMFGLNEMLRAYFEASAEFLRDLTSLVRIQEIKSSKKTKSDLGNKHFHNMTMTPTELSFENIVACYPDSEVPIIKNLSFMANKEKMTVIRGKTGSGKSSIFYSIFDDLHITNGKILLNNIEYEYPHSHNKYKDIFYLMDCNLELMPGTIRDNLDPSNIYSENYIWNVLSIVGIENHIKELPLNLEEDAQGYSLEYVFEKRLLLLAKAFLAKPTVLMLDEPFSELSDQQCHIIKRILDRYKHECILLAIDHELQWSQEHSNLIHISRGLHVNV